jgi:hypothetical protein
VDEFEEHEELVCLSYNSCYVFEILDKWDDGICCVNGKGSYAGFLQYEEDESATELQGLLGEGELLPIPGLNGGAFTDSLQHKFCLDDNGIIVEGLGRNA